MKDDPFGSARFSVEHAKTHIAQVNTFAKAFFDSKPYSLVTKPDPFYPGYKLQNLRLTQPLPKNISAFTSDAIKNLRASLDHLGFAVAVAAGKSGSNAHFPFGDTWAEVQSRRTHRSKHIPDEIFDLMVSFEPYKGSDISLWALNKIGNANKHESLVQVVLFAQQMTYESPDFRLTTGPRQSENGDIPVAWLQPGQSATYQNLKVDASIRFNDIDGVKLERPAVALLHTFADRVTYVIDAVEAKSRLMGLIA